MSLFDVLRYPISDKPTYEELDALPKSLFDKWCILCFHYTYPVTAIVQHFYYIKHDSFVTILCIDKLRKMIREYDDNL